MAKHFHLDITDTALTVCATKRRIDAEAALDGIYVLRTSVDADELDPAAVVTSYKNLATVERDFRSQNRTDGATARHHRRRARQSPRTDLHARLLPGVHLRKA